MKKNFCQTCGRDYEYEREETYYDDDEDDSEDDSEDMDDLDDDFDDDEEDMYIPSTRKRSSLPKKKSTAPIWERARTIPGTNTTPSGQDYIQLIAEAIQIHEGWFPPSAKNPRGSVSYRNKNPGNLKFAGQREAIGRDERGFAIFPTVEAGQRALLNDINAKFTRNPNLTIEGLISVYAPSSDNNNEQAYVNFIKDYINKNV